jgi:hypothetical protein|tara:strand:- start:312 stop:689 length:378 start_codon:yes stop_codon:yes gene_type:complete
MGMDIYALAPNPEVKGSDYFRNNVWWWRPLWEFVVGCCPDILTEDDAHGGQFNDGHRITENKAVAIGTRLLQMKEDGDVDKYVEEYKARVDKTDKDDWDRSYPIDSENVEAFANFCIHSGGFEIC